MTGDATVSPTSGLVSEHFSLVRVASLVGLLFLCHQVGAFGRGSAPSGVAGIL